MKDKEYLIKFLLNKTVDAGARDDCAMDLADYDDEDVKQALYSCACDPTELNIIQSSCGEALAEIMVRQSILEKKYVEELSESAFAELRGYILRTKPEWIIQLQE